MKRLLIFALLGTSIMTLGPKGMELGSIDSNTGGYATVSPQGMTLGDINPQSGEVFQLGKGGMTVGEIKQGMEVELPMPKVGLEPLK
jgi:hypothetical protein